MKSILMVLMTIIALSNADVMRIENQDAFEKTIKTENRLLVFDMYADWCMPCKMLAPTMEKLSDEYTNVDFYKIDVDKVPSVSRAFGVSGIPYVVFFKNNTLLYSLTGLQNEKTYRATINRFSAENFLHTTSGSLRKGIRIVKVSKPKDFKGIYVYPHEKIKIKSLLPHSVNLSIPKINFTKTLEVGNDVLFAVGDTGEYVIYGKSGKNIGKITVIEKMTKDYNDINAKQASQFLKDDYVVLIDVRTKKEFVEGHISSAKLFPLQTLEKNLGKLEEYRGRPILLYCRSGNRSSQAARILYDNGFTSVFNMAGGINGWKKAGFSVTK